MDGERRFKWNSWPFVVFRVIAYLIIIGLLWHWKTSIHRPASGQPQDSAPGEGKPAAPGEAGTTVETTLYYPQVTLYGWAVRPTKEGGQQVDVLLKFDANCAEVEYSELQLRAKGSDENLTTAEAPLGREKLCPGLGALRFLVPAGQPEFRAGRVFCWVKDLCVLDSNQRVTPERLDQWAKELRSEPERKPDVEPTTQPPALLPERA